MVDAAVDFYECLRACSFELDDFFEDSWLEWLSCSSWLHAHDEYVVNEGEVGKYFFYWGCGVDGDACFDASLLEFVDECLCVS